MRILTCVTVAAIAVATAAAQSIGQINGDKFLSPFSGQKVTGVTGVVTAKSKYGLYMRSLKPTGDSRVSDSIYVYGTQLAKNTSIVPGDVIVIDGEVSEYRSSLDYLPLTEITFPNVTSVLEHNRTFDAVVIGDKLKPPTKQYSSLDGGDVFAVPGNKSLISSKNPTLQPHKYGLDFWESLSGEYVIVKNARAVGRPNQYGDTWIIGSWATTGENERTGLTVSSKDGNPESILISTPLDGTYNADDGKVGDLLEDITGVLTYAFGFYQIQPLTKLTVKSSLEPTTPGPTKLVSTGSCSGITVASYNIENFYPGSAKHVAAVAASIVDYMRTPDLIALQEIQDNNGEKDDGTVDSGTTLSTLAAAIAGLPGGVTYNYTYINPIDGENGGAPGGNIRNAYLYRPDVLQLKGGSAAVIGNSVTANEVVAGPALKYNPGLIDPTNEAWTDSRKPLVAAWELVGSGSKKGQTLFTVNVHFASKGGSTSLHGDARPPINGGVEQRIAQATVTGEFVAEILRKDHSARVVVLGDYNEYQFVAPVEELLKVSGLEDLDEVVGIEEEEQYSYVYNQNMQELDHVLVSKKLGKGAQLEHLHINSWLSYDDKTSDHDPSIAKFNIC